MKATQLLHDLGQSLWLDNITRDLLNSGRLKRYIGELSVIGLTSNPTIFDHALKNSTADDEAVREELVNEKTGEGLFLDLTLAIDIGEAHVKILATAQKEHREYEREETQVGAWKKTNGSPE